MMSMKVPGIEEIAEQLLAKAVGHIEELYMYMWKNQVKGARIEKDYHVPNALLLKCAVAWIEVHGCMDEVRICTD